MGLRREDTRCGGGVREGYRGVKVNMGFPEAVKDRFEPGADAADLTDHRHSGGKESTRGAFALILLCDKQ
jgi:hypothetical protein